MAWTKFPLYMTRDEMVLLEACLDEMCHADNYENQRINELLERVREKIRWVDHRDRGRPSDDS